MNKRFQSPLEKALKTFDSATKKFPQGDFMSPKLEALLNPSCKTPRGPQNADLPQLIKPSDPQYDNQMRLLTPRTLAMNKLKCDKQEWKGLDKRSRDLSHNFEHSNLATRNGSRQKILREDNNTLMHASFDNPKINTPHNEPSENPMSNDFLKSRPNLITAQTDRLIRVNSTSPEKIIEKHLVSIYKNPDILTNSKLLDEQAEKYRQCIFSCSFQLKYSVEAKY